MHAFLLAVTLAAATGGAKPAAKHIDIDDDEVVEGTTARGDGDEILARQKKRFQSLIRLREDFRREMMKSFDSL